LRDISLELRPIRTVPSEDFQKDGDFGLDAIAVRTWLAQVVSLLQIGRDILARQDRRR
jgi:hypothetical protein